MARAARRSGVEMAARAVHGAWVNTAAARFRGGLVASVGAALLVAFASYHAADPSLDAASGERPRNLLGGIGAAAADLGLQTLG
ncbi:MAG TPA: DNA translocase FtsK 4TM domain-containing protein, partial [Caulobacteraceae bacterium]|nr:DNA translocase FtsK 4TM domain-containing protein [Caulobacteraceae bacterium]